MTLRPAAVVGTVLAAAGTVVAALFDPSWLIGHPDLVFGIGFTIVKGGERVAPTLPWDTIVLMLVAGSLVLTAAKIHKMRTSNQ